MTAGDKGLSEVLTLKILTEAIRSIKESNMAPRSPFGYSIPSVFTGGGGSDHVYRDYYICKDCGERSPKNEYCSRCDSGGWSSVRRQLVPYIIVWMELSIIGGIVVSQFNTFQGIALLVGGVVGFIAWVCNLWFDWYIKSRFRFDFDMFFQDRLEGIMATNVPKKLRKK